ncbi:Dipicolinate synthase subunit B [compost metagenome]
MLREKTGNEIVDTIVKAEPVGPSNLIDVMVICPCTGNTLAKLASAITDTPVLMVTKSQLRNNKPVVLGISTNDALGLNAKNLGLLLNSKGVFFIPFGQDDYLNKPKSLSLDYSKIVDTIELAAQNRQLQPILSVSK